MTFNDPAWYYRPIQRTPPLDVKGFTSVELRDGWLYVGRRVRLDVGRPMVPESVGTPMWMPAALLGGLAAALWVVYRLILFCDAALAGWRP